MKTLIPLALAGACLLSAAPAWSEVRALLVGVGDYRYLDADLRGPVNDVGLMARTLIGRGAQHVSVLADPGARLPEGLAAPLPPTRAAILQGLGDLARSARPGDTVVFYFSGHGAQAPDQNGDEAGGYDEILLPADAKNWNGAIGAVENAILDDEFQPLFQAILDTGATLVAIIDACHSATGFRATGSAAGAERFISTAMLGIPEVAVAPAAPAGPPAPPLSGQFVFLYSSQSDERSFEYPLGDSADLSNWYGDFTRALAGVLNEVPSLTWAQALAASTDRLQNGAATAVQTPDGEGTALDDAVFGAAAPGARRVAFTGGMLDAGLLAGFSEGAVFELYAAAAGGTTLGRAVLQDVGADRARLVPESGTLPASGYGVQVRPGLPAPFRLSVPVIVDPSGNGPMLDVLAALAAAGLPEGVEWNSADPDAVILLADGQLALAGPDGVLDPGGPGSTPRMGEDGGAFFERAARVHRLRQALALAESNAPRAFAMPGTGLVQRIERQSGAPGADGCDEPLTDLSPFDPARPLGQCDRLWVSLTNTSGDARDVTVLYVDRAFNISVLWPEPGLGNRINTGESREIGLEMHLPDGLPGLEELIVIAVPARPGSPRTVLAALADPSATRGGPGAPGLQLYLETAIDPATASRSFAPGTPIAPPTITRTRLHLAPNAP